MVFGRQPLAAALGYALGAIPVADAVARHARSDQSDLREIGSRNPGAANVSRQIGKRWGSAVFAGDVVKGALAAHIGRRVGGAVGANVAATAAVVGHCHPPGREGGKGVATSIGQVVGTFPGYLPLDIAVGAATAALPKWTQRSWAATSVASAVWVTAATVAWRKGWSTGPDARAPAALPLAAALSSAVIARRFAATPLAEGPRTDDR
ncbi:MAG: glycerol-3-phosphate acyltransferase [Acidimicrobiales bacterium]